MASQINHRVGTSSLPIDAMLATLPSLPRPVLTRLVARMIEYLDEMDGDPDAEEADGGGQWIDGHGRWIGPGPCPDGPWYEDDEENGDLEATEEREPEEYDGGHPNPPLPYNTSMQTA